MSRQTLVQGAIAAGIGTLIYDYFQGDDGIIWPQIRDFLYSQSGQRTKTRKEPVKKILVLGLEGAGKSTILQDFGSQSDCADGKKVAQNPTQGSKVLTVTVEDIPLEIREIGGSMRKFWFQFFERTDLLVFVIDSSAKHKSVAYELMRQTVTHQKLLHVPLLLVASKQDLSCALSPEELVDQSQIKALIPLRCLTYVGCSNQFEDRKKVQHLMLELVV